MEHSAPPPATEQDFQRIADKYIKWAIINIPGGEDMLINSAPGLYILIDDASGRIAKLWKSTRIKQNYTETFPIFKTEIRRWVRLNIEAIKRFRNLQRQYILASRN